MNKGIVSIALLLCVFMVSGCKTAQKKQDEVTGLKTRVETLEQRVEGIEAKQSEADRAATEQAQALEEIGSSRNDGVKTNVVLGGSERIKELQMCLKSAGFYEGAIDGVKGKGTKKAIKEFQKANGLSADGVVGKKTWQLLRKYKTE